MTIDDLPTTEPELSPRTQKVLEKNGVALEELSNMTVGQVFSLYGLGRKMFNEIQDVLESKGLALPSSHSPCNWRFRPESLFQKSSFVVSDLPIEYSLYCRQFLVRLVTEEFIVVEYPGGPIVRLPLKEVGSDISVISGQTKVSSIPTNSLIEGLIFNKFSMKYRRSRCRR